MAVETFAQWEQSNPEILNENEREIISLLTTFLSNNSITTDDSIKPIQVRESSVAGEIEETFIINTQQQFLAWFQDIQEEMEKGQDDVFKSHLNKLDQERARMEKLLEKMTISANLICELQNNFQFVNSKTEGLQNACEQLLNEQQHLVGVLEDISQKMLYFEELEPISQALNQPGDVLLKDPRFLQMLQKLDQCLAFIFEHPHYKDSGLYNMRYRQCLTRGLTLIKLYVVEALRQLQFDVKEKISSADGPLAPNVQLSLFYVKFKSLASKTKYLITEIEARCPSHHEYFSLLDDCIETMASIRKSLLTDYISQNIKEKHSDPSIVAFTTKGMAYMLRVCTDEYQLFREFFTLGEDSIRAYLEDLSTILSHQLRPRILKESRIDILADLCSSLLFHLTPSENFEETHDSQIDSPVKKDDSVKFIVESILFDAQSRLSFRSQEFIQVEIRQFKSTEKEMLVFVRGADLPQPATVNSTSDGVAEVLRDASSRRSSVLMSPSVEAALDGNDARPEKLDLAFGGGEWYPSLQKTVSLLSKLHASLPSASFDDLAQDAVDACITSLAIASEMMATQQSPIDGYLFLIKNLLQLRETISYYDAKLMRSTRNVKLGDILLALRGVLQNPLTISNYGNLTKPFVATLECNVRETLDEKLKFGCEGFIHEATRIACGTLSEFLKQVKVKSRATLFDEAIASKSSLISVYQKFLECLNENLVSSVNKLRQYLGDKSTQLTLIKIVRNSIMSQFDDFKDLVQSSPYGIIEEIGDANFIASTTDGLIESALQRSTLSRTNSGT